MARISDALRLSADQVDQIMRTSKTLRIATLGPGARINLTPMTFGWAMGKVFIFGRGQKIANLRRSSTATVLVDLGDSWRQLQGIMMHGTARVLETAAAEDAEPGLAEARLNLGVKHSLRSGDKAISHPATASGASRRWIVFTPEHTVSWDNGKLPL